MGNQGSVPEKTKRITELIHIQDQTNIKLSIYNLRFRRALFQYEIKGHKFDSGISLLQMQVKAAYMDP